MTLVEPLRRQDAPELDDVFEQCRRAYGFIPDSYLVLARNPSFFRAFSRLEHVGLWSGSLDQADRLLVAAVAGAESGSVYTLSQMGVALDRADVGAGAEKLRAALTQLETTPLLRESQRAALRFARDMATIPNRVRPGHFNRLREHYAESEIVELAFVACHAGFLSRFDGMAGCTLEHSALDWALENLADLGWDPEGGGTEAATTATAALQLDKPPLQEGEEGRRLGPLRQEHVPQLAEQFARLAGPGFVPNSLLIMARRPDLVVGVEAALQQLLADRTIPSDVAYMASWVASYASGCQYCQAHTSVHAASHGVDAEKIESLWSFETSPLFSHAERSALRLALAGASQPSGMTREIADDLHTHFVARQLVDLMIAVANFGFYNRWNDTFATPLEDEPFAFASAHLTGAGWDGGPHASSR